jgi:hypothetical protein
VELRQEIIETQKARMDLHKWKIIYATFAAFGRLVVNVFDAIAEARVPAPTESGVTNRSVCHAANPDNNTRYNADD